ncbi:MAG: hypothetical protein ACYTF2_00215 [Planctomycetota bacterium]
MRYLFWGSRRQTGEPVEGRVTAPTEDVALDVLRDNGIDADSLKPEPAAHDDEAATATEPRFAHALERALEDAGCCVSFDLLTGRYQGKSVCLLDQDKIRRRVMELVNDGIVDGPGVGGNGLDARRHIAQLLEQLLQEQRSLGSERSPHAQALEDRVNHITQALGRIEKVMASMSSAARRPGRGRPRRTVAEYTARDKTRDEVLVEVFESNLELIRGLEEPASPPAAGGGSEADRVD